MATSHTLPRVYRNATIAALLVLGLACWGQPVHGQDTHVWNNPDGGIYSTIGNWDPIGAPSPLDTAQFDLDAEYDVSFIDNRAVAQLLVDAGAVSFLGAGILGEGDRTYAIDDVAIARLADLILERDSSERDLNLAVQNSLAIAGRLIVRDSAIVESPAAAIDSGGPA